MPTDTVEHTRPSITRVITDFFANVHDFDTHYYNCTLCSTAPKRELLCDEGTRLLTNCADTVAVYNQRRAELRWVGRELYGQTKAATDKKSVPRDPKPRCFQPSSAEDTRMIQFAREINSNRNNVCKVAPVWCGPGKHLYFTLRKPGVGGNPDSVLCDDWRFHQFPQSVVVCSLHPNQ